MRLGGRADCSACAQGKGWGAGVFGRLLRRRPVSLEFENTLEAMPGQAVIVGLPEGLFLRLAARLYLYPLLGGLGGAACGHHLAGIAALDGSMQDLLSLLSGLAAGGVVLYATRRGDAEFSTGSAVRLLRTAGES